MLEVVGGGWTSISVDLHAFVCRDRGGPSEIGRQCFRLQASMHIVKEVTRDLEYYPKSQAQSDP
jgi:hypothetical protein